MELVGSIKASVSSPLDQLTNPRIHSPLPLRTTAIYFQGLGHEETFVLEGAFPFKNETDLNWRCRQTMYA